MQYTTTSLFLRKKSCENVIKIYTCHEIIYKMENIKNVCMSFNLSDTFTISFTLTLQFYNNDNADLVNTRVCLFQSSLIRDVSRTKTNEENDRARRGERERDR